jgi:hypothetical protein
MYVCGGGEVKRKGGGGYVGGGEKNIVGDTVLFQQERVEYLVPVCKLVRGSPLFYFRLNIKPFRVKYQFWPVHF